MSNECEKLFEDLWDYTQAIVDGLNSSKVLFLHKLEEGSIEQMKQMTLDIKRTAKEETDRYNATIKEEIDRGNAKAHEVALLLVRDNIKSGLLKGSNIANFKKIQIQT